MAPRFPIYQIDFAAVAAGKHVASTKRRIKWRFGYPNEDALAQGRTGTDCRGEEHDVVIVWSITSGKQQILMDGKEVRYMTVRSNVLEHSWSTRGNHIVKVVCHAAPPMTATPGFRQYDLFVDGQSFFSMPKVFELGLRGGGKGRTPGRRTPPPSSGIKPPVSAQQEQEDIQKAIRASLAESEAHLARKQAPAPAPLPPAPPAPPAADIDDMTLGMVDPTAPAYDAYGQPAYQQPAVAYGQPPPAAYGQPPAAPAYPTENAGAAAYPALPATPATAQDPGYAQPPAAYAAPPAAATGTLFADNYTAAPAPTDIYDSYATEDPFAPKPAAPPTQSEMHNEILKGYGDTARGVQSAVGFESPDAKGAPPALTNGETPASTGASSMMQFEEEEPQNPFDAALKKLVNVDHIDQPAEAHLEMKKKKDEQETMMKKGKSKGLPPAAHQVVGGQATLEQISEVKTKKEPKGDIMNAAPTAFNPAAQQAGMLVVYGQPGDQQGPPPLQPQGFGVGAQQGYGGYAAQPGYGAPPAYGAQPGYGQPAYGAQPGYPAQPPPAY